MSPPPPPIPHPLRVLISGAGIAGPCLAFWLSRLPPSLKCVITIAERHPNLRSTGQQIDLRGQGIAAMRRLGPDFERTLRGIIVKEPGVKILNRWGREQAYLASNKSGKGAQSFSAEWELMRGEVCEKLWEVTKGLEGVTYRFGNGVREVEERESGVVRARFDDGTEEYYDLVVAADGVGSRIRRGLMKKEGRKEGEELTSLGVSIAYFTVPTMEGDVKDAMCVHLPGKRMIMTRKDKPDCLRVYFTMIPKEEDAKELSRVMRHGTMVEQKEVWAKVFSRDLEEGGTWQLPRFLDAMLNSPLADDFFAQDLVQVRLDKWHEGRVVLLGDAGYCASPLSGMGTSMAFAGAYVLAGEIARVCGKAAQEEGADPWASLPEALAAYETSLRPFVKDVQGENLKKAADWMLPESDWWIKAFHWLFWLLTTLRVDKIASYFGSDDTGSWKLPDYSEFLDEPGKRTSN